MMLVCKVVLVIVFLAVPLNAQRRYNSAKTYKIPEPLIEAYKPSGFSVSIEDEPGIRLFAFHGNINEELRDLSAGEYSIDILHTKDGRWTFEDRNTRLHVGDIIYYWLFVIKDDLGYRLNDGWFKVTELVDPPYEPPPSVTRRPRPRPRPTQSSRPETNPSDTSCNTIPQQTAITTESPDRERESFLRVCEFSLLNITQAFLSVQAQMDALRRTNEELTTLLERYPDSKELKLSGRLPPDDDSPITTARFIVRGKLDLNPDIISAVRNSDNSISFKVAKFSDKLEILEVAKEKLKNSRITIS